MPRLIIGQKVLEGYNPLEDGRCPSMSRRCGTGRMSVAG
jgi:hypothetical protein